MKQEFMTWQEFDEACEVLRNKLEPMKKNGLIKNVYGIPRGGLVLAVKLSHLLGLELITEQSSIGNRTLVVDDISDTGKTLLEIITTYELNFTATLYYRKKTQFMPDVTYQERPEGIWIVFPWEH